MEQVQGSGQAAPGKRQRKDNGNSKAIIPVASAMVALGTLQAATPAALVEQASAMATALAKVIKSKKLFTTIQGKDHVHVEGWTTLGAMLGILPREVSVTEEWGIYTATIELVRMSDGAILSRASAECGDEAPWCDRPRYARRSMALTRATGKACRLAFSWIMALSGYAVCPAEEMEGGAQRSQPSQRSEPSQPDRLSPEQLAKLRGLIGQCTTESKFCAYLKIKSITELDASRFDPACAALRQKIGSLAKAGNEAVA